MPKFVSLYEASFALNTSRDSIMVTACNYKKRYGKYPSWYSSDGKVGGKKSYIDIEYLLGNIVLEAKRRQESSSILYWKMIDYGYSQADIAKLLTSKSEAFDKYKSWLSFMQVTLFCEPRFKFTDIVTRTSEFHRIITDFIEEKEAGISA